jgi:mono/diheme cytochrome c family protein
MTNRSRVVATLLLLGAASAAAAADPQEGGGSIFKTYCASCHGPEANGDGPLAQQLRTAPPDLTRLAQRNKGRFDADKVHRIIDGRDPVKGHGGPDMPVWGDAFKESREGYSESKVKSRIAALVEYLASIQSSGQRP